MAPGRELLAIYDREDNIKAVGDREDICRYTGMTRGSLNSAISRIRRGKHTGNLCCGYQLYVFDGGRG